ncbi:MAG: hypothetical protein ABR507_08940 [Actinomycetota bacterium]
MPVEEPRSAKVNETELAGTLLGFWTELHVERKGWLRLVSGFLVGRKLHGVTEKRFAWPSQAIPAAAWASHEALLGRDLYQQGRLMARRHGKMELAGDCVFGEFTRDDIGLYPEPTFLVETGPGRVQAYWRTDKTMTRGELARLSVSLDWNQKRLLRLPATPNRRYQGCPTMSVTSTGLVYPLWKFERDLPEFSIERWLEPVPQRRKMVASLVMPIITSPWTRLGLVTATAVLAISGGFIIPSVEGHVPSSDIAVASAPQGSGDIPVVKSVTLAQRELAPPAISALVNLPSLPTVVEPVKRSVANDEEGGGGQSQTNPDESVSQGSRIAGTFSNRAIYLITGP